MYDSKKTLFVGFPFEIEVGPKEAKETQGRIVKAFEEQTNTKYNVVDYIDAAGMVDHPILGLAKALTGLAKADLAVFSEDWRTSTVCTVLKLCADKYQIQNFDLSLLVKEDDKNAW